MEVIAIRYFIKMKYRDDVQDKELKKYIEKLEVLMEDDEVWELTVAEFDKHLDHWKQENYKKKRHEQLV